MMDVCHYTFIQALQYTTLRVKLNVNYECWLIIMCQCRFAGSKWRLSGSNWPAVVLDVMGEFDICGDKGCLWEHFVLLDQLCCDLRLPKKNLS